MELLEENLSLELVDSDGYTELEELSLEDKTVLETEVGRGQGDDVVLEWLPDGEVDCTEGRVECWPLVCNDEWMDECTL